MAVNKKISLFMQFSKVRKTFENWDCHIYANKILVIVGEVQPSALSVNYKIRIEYSLNQNRPIVEVLSPNLKIHPKWEELPHIFPGNKLCLYHNEFNPYADYIADTNIIWVTWWLYFYEIWLITGVWKGGGIEHKRK